MKKATWKLQFIIIFTILAFGLRAQQIRIQDPKSPWKLYSADLKDALISIKPQGLFVEFGIYLSYAVPSDFGLSQKDTFEIQHFFQLPEKAIVSDSWLWVNDNIMQARVLDRWSAFNIYEGIVNRRRDPSILYKNTAVNYEYRIFPLAGGNNIRKVKLTFLIPADWTDGKLSAEIPLGLLAGANKTTDIKLIAYENSEWKNPQLTSGTAFNAVQDSTLGSILTGTIKSSEQTPRGSISVVYSGKKSSGIYFSHFQDNNKPDEGIYQLAVQPKELLPPSAVKPRKILILIDHDETSAQFSSKVLLQTLRNYLINNLEPRDSFNIFYTKLSIKKISPTWMVADSANIFYSMNQLQPGTTSALRTGLYESYDYLAKHPGGTLMVITSDQTITNQTVAQKFKDELVNEYKTLPPTFVVDYSNFSSTVTWQQGVYYYGNEIFYLILTSNTFGSHLHVNKYPDNYNLSKAITEILSSIDNNQYGDTNFEFYLKPSSGVCFERMDLYRDAQNGSKPMIQCGKYKGTLPIDLETTVVRKGEIFVKSVTLPVNTDNINNERFSQIHAGMKVIDLDARPTLSSIQISNIIEISKQNRVLSRLTAFIALEPGMQEPCSNCLNETKTGGNVAATDLNKDSVQVSIFPNPFSDRVEIKISGISPTDSRIETSILNSQGILLQKFEQPAFSDGKINLEWNAGDLPPGLYFFRLQTSEHLSIRKILKSD